MSRPELSLSDVFPAAIHLIQTELLPTATPHEHYCYSWVMRNLAVAQPKVERRHGKSAHAELNLTMGIPPPTDAENLISWGLQLRRRREETGLSRTQLARMTGVADSTIRNLETGRHQPTRPIVMRLQAVPDLGIPSPFPLLGEDAPVQEVPPSADPAFAHLAFACNCWFTPEYDALRINTAMKKIINGLGGRVEQSYLYADPASAADWCALTALPVFTNLKEQAPLKEIAARLRQIVGETPLDIIGLGSGEARDEVRLAKSLLSARSDPMRLFLLDISQPLLSTGYRYAAQRLGARPGIAVYAVQGDFHNLPSYSKLLDAPARRRLACMFGCTFGTLDDELQFLRESLSGFVAGDLLLIDATMAVASTSQPDEILKRDPRLGKRFPYNSSALERREAAFLMGPFKRYINGIRGVGLNKVLDLTNCPIPGSYAIDWHATARPYGTEPREFSILRNKRYDPQLLNECMQSHGWHPVERWIYADKSNPHMLCLYQNRESVGLPAWR